jgi:EpsD family peptidyl-prolyl cis-trans isomerase
LIIDRASTSAYAIAICVTLVAACTKKVDQQPLPSGQIVARMGNQVITKAELDDEMRVANVPVESRSDPKFIKPVLDEMTLRKYLVQEAIDSKLDQDPSVSLNMIRSREQVMASAVMARKSAKFDISNDDIDRFIAENPAKFAERVLLTVDEVKFALTPNIRLLLEANKSAVSLDEVDRILTLRQIPHIRSVVQLSQADLPEAVASAIKADKPDGILFEQVGPNGVYFIVKSKDSQPLLGTDARTTARQLLYAQHAKDLLAAAKLAAQGATTYSPEFAPVMAAPAVSPDPGASTARP